MPTTEPSSLPAALRLLVADAALVQGGTTTCAVGGRAAVDGAHPETTTGRAGTPGDGRPGGEPGETLMRLALADAVIDAEKRREEAISLLGWLVLRVTWSQVMRPGDLRRRVDAARTERRALAPKIRGSAKPVTPR